MKNIFLTFLLIFSFIANSIAQPLNLPEITETVLETSAPTEGNDFVTQHEDITLKLGTLEFPAIFLYEDEASPYQGYLIKFGDFIRIETLFNNINKGCDILYDELLKTCKSDLEKCQKDCDERVASLLRDKDKLELSLKLQIEKTDSEVTRKYLWASASLFVGAGLGVLIFKLSN